MVDATSIEALRQSVGKCQEACDPIALAPARHLAATFDRGDADLVEGGALPPADGVTLAGSLIAYGAPSAGVQW